MNTWAWLALTVLAFIMGGFVGYFVRCLTIANQFDTAGDLYFDPVEQDMFLDAEIEKFPKSGGYTIFKVIYYGNNTKNKTWPVPGTLAEKRIQSAEKTGHIME